MRILVAEPDQKMARLLERALSEEGYAVDCCARGADVLIRQSASGYDLVLLDRTIPDIDGLELCREVRRNGSDVLIVVLSRRDDVNERVAALRSGADDCLPKTVDLHELLARIRALLRRATGAHAHLRFGPLQIDQINRCILLDGAPIDLTTREFALLLHLAHFSNRVVTRSELLTRVWSLPFDPGSNVVEAQIRRLRRRLGTHAWLIETVRARGYRLRTSMSRR